MKLTLILSFLLALCAGCSTVPNAERGPDGTIAYHVEVEASEPDVRIEANNDYVGKTPLTLKIWGDQDGTFHNFGFQQYVIRAFPNQDDQEVQTKIFRTGGWFSQEDQIPSRVYFDMDQKGAGATVNPPRY